MGMEGMDEGTSFTCAGVAWSVRADNSGTWTDHVIAGTLLLAWALHWNVAVFSAWLTQGRKQQPFRSSSCYALPFLPERWPIEPLLKVLVPAVAILVTLLPGGWRSNTCSEGTPREGHFDPENIFRYANVWVLFAFMASGLVDLLGWFVELPDGSQACFMAAAFMLQSFLLVQGQYTNMLEDMVYYMLFLVSTGTAVFTLGEIAWPHNFWASCGRVYCTYLQAIWYFSAAHILYEGRVAWDSRHPLPDMAPAAFVPVPFVFIMNMTSLYMFLVFVVMRAIMNKRGSYGLVSNTADTDSNGVWSRGSGTKADGLSREGAANELVPLVARNI